VAVTRACAAEHRNEIYPTRSPADVHLPRGALAIARIASVGCAATSFVLDGEGVILQPDGVPDSTAGLA